MNEENMEATETNVGEQNENNPNKRKWRKKRKNFLSNAKKYAKKGQMGRGTQIPEELYQYFVGILEAIKQGIEDKDEKQVLVNNVLERTKGEELNIISNQLGCRVIELLIPYSKPEDLERYIEVVNTDLRRLCSDNFCGYVLNSMLTECSHRATDHLQNYNETDEVPKKKRKEESQYSEGHINNCHEFVTKMSKYVLNNLEDFVWESNTNHMVRTVLKCVSGINLLPGEKPKINLFKEPIAQNKGIPPHQIDVKYRNVPEDFTEIVKEFGNRLSMWPQFKDLAYENMTSALLQVLLFAVKNADKSLTKGLLKKLLNESFAPDDWTPGGSDDKKDEKYIKNDDANGDVEDCKDVDKNGDVEDCKDVDKNGDTDCDKSSSNLPPVFQSEAAVRLLEAALFVAKKKMYTQIYAKCFINRLGQLATLRTLNFTVQRLIDNCLIKEEFEPIFEELCPKFEEIMSCGNTGVLVALAKACHRLKSKQTQFVQHLEAVLKSTEDEKYFSVLCLRLQPLDKVDVNKLSEEYFINIHGSIILQTVLDFQRPTKAVSSLLSLSGEELLVILCDAKGSHVADAFCAGQYVGVKSRDKLVKRLKGYYQKLALSQHGSRAFEQIFAASSPEQQVAILTELSDKSSLLNGSQYGRIIATKYDLATFKLSQKSWEKARKKAKKNLDD